MAPFNHLHWRSPMLFLACGGLYNILQTGLTFFLTFNFFSSCSVCNIIQMFLVKDLNQADIHFHPPTPKACCTLSARLWCDLKQSSVKSWIWKGKFHPTCKPTTNPNLLLPVSSEIYSAETEPQELIWVSDAELLPQRFLDVKGVVVGCTLYPVEKPGNEAKSK